MKSDRIPILSVCDIKPHDVLDLQQYTVVITELMWLEGDHHGKWSNAKFGIEPKDYTKIVHIGASEKYSQVTGKPYQYYVLYDGNKPWRIGRGYHTPNKQK